MNTIKLYGKFLDQPVLVKKFEKSVPYILGVGGGVFCLKDTFSKPQGHRTKGFINSAITMGVTIASALAAPKITGKIFKNAMSQKPLQQVINEQTKLIDEFMKEAQLSKEVKGVLSNSRGKIFSPEDLKKVMDEVYSTENGKRFINKLIPEPDEISAEEIFSKIGELSLLGLIPVIGGILGGIAADSVTTRFWRKRVPDKLKEGAYQYLANIFLCNVGAGIALSTLERFNVKSKSARAFGMVSGILATGVIGGSAIANFIGQKIINPIINPRSSSSRLYSERRPEPLDIGLHTDDIATVAVMSGLKWIEPALPIMYAISGYRAGIGYRNNKGKQH